MPILAAAPTAGYAALLADLGADADRTIAELRDQVADLQARVDRWEPKLDVRATNITATTAKLQWNPVPGSTSYTTGRDGSDNRGNPPITFNDPPTATSRDFIWLVTGHTYQLMVTAQPSGISQTVAVTPQ